ncbi:type IV secretion system DNA-binding domain-containing protein, partial [Patescibacteria group bacterium]|nr:type IV secretion system DNA-binding domain-containing protein [Patescibacteria group bacterium]
MNPTISSPVTDASILTNPVVMGVLILVAIVAFVIIVLQIFRKYFHSQYHIPSEYHNTTLLITVPKDFTKEEDKNKEIKQLIGIAENLFANLGGLKPQKGISTYFYGRKDHIALEIVKERTNNISFFITVPEYFHRFLEQQIHAQYPDAQIEPKEDYNIFTPQGIVQGAYLQLKKQYIFPIQTFQNMETDPLNAITNSLSRFQENEGGAIQILIRSAKASWHAWPAKVASEMQQGKKLKEALRSSSKAGAKGFAGGVMKSVFSSSKSKEDEMLNKTQLHQLSPMEEETIKVLEQKTAKAGFDVNIRIVVSAKQKQQAEAYLRNVIDAFSQYAGYEYGNGFRAVKVGNNQKLINAFIYRRFVTKRSFILNTEEIASLYHLPLPYTETPNIRWLSARKAAPPSNLPQEGIVLGETEYRGVKSLIRIKDKDRQRHVYIIGQTGSGKSYTMANMAVQDIQRGDGCCLIDPHGGLIDEYVLPNIPKERVEDVIYFDPSDMERPMGLNLLEYDKKYPEQKTFVINEMINIFDKLYNLSQTGGPMFEQYMRNAMLLVMDDPNDTATLLEIPRVLADKQYRTEKLSRITNIVVKRFWEEEAEKAGGEAALANMVPYITSKLSTFISNDYMRPIIAQKESGFNFRKVMDEKKILLINLSKGRIGDINAKLLGLVMVGKILMASLSRVDIPEEKRQPFYLYIDEFQNYVTDSIAVILSEARKYKLCLTMAHQYVGQLVDNGDSTIKDAVFGNVGTIGAYRVGVEDAELFAKQFEPIFNEYDVMNVDQYTFNLKLLIDNTHARP